MSFLGKVRGAFDWVPRPVAREFWWFCLVCGLASIFLMVSGGSPRGGASVGSHSYPGASDGLLDPLGYWGLPIAFSGVYLVVIALRVVVPRLRGSNMDRVAREIQEARRKREG
jgi:uncharacterized membrane protein YhaH (DUF805 family)